MFNETLSFTLDEIHRLHTNAPQTEVPNQRVHILHSHKRPQYNAACKFLS